MSGTGPLMATLSLARQRGWRDHDTIGVPRFGPGGYYLTNVLFTQYFTGDGASIHYNYWSTAASV